MNVGPVVRRYPVAPYSDAFLHLRPRRTVGLLLVLATLLGVNASALSPGKSGEVKNT